MGLVRTKAGKRHSSPASPYGERKGGKSSLPAAGKAARAREASAKRGTSAPNTAAPSVTGGTGEAWTRAAPSQTRVPTPKAGSADDIWSRGSRYSGIGSSGLHDAYKDRLRQLEGQSQAAKAERAKNAESLRLLYGSQAWDAEQRQYELNRQISGMNSEMDRLKDRIRKGENARLLQQGYRPMSLLDATVRSAKQGYYNSRYGEESFHDMFGSGSDKQKYGDILAGEEYRYTTDNPVLEAVSGAAQLLGQQVRQWTNPQTLAMSVGAAGAAAVAGQMGPQVLIPEEILTVPSATIAGFKTGSSLSNFQIEAGLAYNEMLEKGVSPETAQKIAIGVGGINAALEFAQLDELLDAYKAVRNNPATKTVSHRIFQVLLDRGWTWAAKPSRRSPRRALPSRGHSWAASWTRASGPTAGMKFSTGWVRRASPPPCPSAF